MRNGVEKNVGALFLAGVNNKRSGIYPSSFTNVCFSTKIEFLNGVKYKWGSQGDVSYAKSSWQSPGGCSVGEIP